MRHFDLRGLCQSQNCSVNDKNLSNWISFLHIEMKLAHTGTKGSSYTLKRLGLSDVYTEGA